MKIRSPLIISLALTLLALAGLLIFPAAAALGAREALALCARVIIPSLFPFTALSCMLLELGFPQGMGRLFRPLMRRLFRVSGAGSAVFFLGLAGGYPLGAITVAQLYSEGQIKKSEAERLLGFCNNCGPAFTVAVAGGLVFGSSGAGFLLYGVHVIAAVLTGVMLRGKGAAEGGELPARAALGLSGAFSVGVKRAAQAAVTVCGFVVFFGVLVALLDAVGALPALCGALSARLGLELHFTRSLATGLLEIGTGTASMSGLSLNAQNLALAAFILGWGGLSVQTQSAAVIKESGLRTAKHLYGKALHGILSALICYFAFPLFFK